MATEHTEPTTLPKQPANGTFNPFPYDLTTQVKIGAVVAATSFLGGKLLKVPGIAAIMPKFVKNILFINK